jgi:hypothetical protein
MFPSAIHVCQCERCRQGAAHPDQQSHREINQLMSSLPRRLRRVYAAVEANRLGRVGVRLVSQVTGLSMATIRVGQRELAQRLRGDRGLR